MSNVKCFFFHIKSILMVLITKQTSQLKFPRKSREELNKGLVLTSRNFRLWCCVVHIRYKVTLAWTRCLGVASAGHAPDFCNQVHCASASFLPLFWNINTEAQRLYRGRCCNNVKGWNFLKKQQLWNKHSAVSLLPVLTSLPISVLMWRDCLSCCLHFKCLRSPSFGWICTDSAMPFVCSYGVSDQNTIYRQQPDNSGWAGSWLDMPKKRTMNLRSANFKSGRL